MAIEIVSEEQVFGAVRERGPVVPMDVRRIIGMGDTIMIGAMLSTLIARGLVKVTHMKRGGSPFYYVEGQEAKLEELSRFLNDKDRKTFDLLRQRKVMRDRAEEPLVRVSLRNIPDFARKFEADVSGEKEVFWRWYMTPENEAVGIFSGRTKVEKKEDVSPAKKEEIKSEAEPVKEVKEKKPVKKREKKIFLEPKKEEAQAQLSETLPAQQPVAAQAVPGDVSPALANFNDVFISKVGEFFAASKITVKEAAMVKRGAEYDIVVELPTPVGGVEYFCKVKGKKKCSEADLSSAFVQGQGKRLPVLFLTTGEAVKKAKDKLKTDFKGMILKEI
jgi:hypothetical protein